MSCPCADQDRIRVVFMYKVHGEGGKEVICVFCGKGFKTQLAARMHENQGLTNSITIFGSQTSHIFRGQNIRNQAIQTKYLNDS